MIETKGQCPYCFGALDKKGACENCGKKLKPSGVPAKHLPPFTLLKNRYRVGVAIGEGGFGITYRGWDELTGYAVAIKEYFPSAMITREGNLLTCKTDDVRQKFILGKKRFASEAKNMAVIKNVKGVTAVLDFFSENDTVYIVMEYLDGVTLDKYLSAVGKLSFERAFSLLRPILEAVRSLHKAGFIHADISPDNIMIMTNGDSKLIDFGSASHVGVFEGRRQVTLKKHFAPPEQYNSGMVLCAETDVYAIGATFYYAVTLTRPPESVKREARDDLRLPGSMGAKITADEERALLTALKLRAEERFGTIDELINAFSTASGNCSKFKEKEIKPSLLKKLFGMKK